MAFEFEGKSIETDGNGYLSEMGDWTEDMGRAMAAEESIELTDRHWDVMNYLRDQYYNNGQVQPNTRTILKAMSTEWGEKVKQKAVYDLFPLDPSKQGGRIAGLPESRRKGGY